MHFPQMFGGCIHFHMTTCISPFCSS